MNYTKRKLLDRVLAMVLTVMMVVAVLPMNVFALENTDYATVTTYTGGVVKNNGTADVEVVVEETTLQWVEGNSQRAEGWWVGIRVEAPDGFSADATYKSKNNPSYEYGDAKKFADYKDGDNYIGLWFPVSPESLIKFANEGRNLTVLYTFDWDADDTYEQEITFSVVPSGKIVLMKGDIQEYPYAENFGVVSTYTGGVVNNNGTANVEVVVEETTLNWVEGNEQRAEGWWVGIKAIAPENFSADATYKSKNNPSYEYGDAKKFADYKDGDNYIGLWFPISAESLIKFAEEGRNLTLVYAFDWNADTVYEQEITFSVVPSEKIILMKNGEQVYPVPSYTVSVTKNEGGSIIFDDVESDSKTVESGTEVQITAKAEPGYQIASLSIAEQTMAEAAGQTEFSTKTAISEDTVVNVTFVKVWTVSVAYNEHGQVKINSDGYGGSVTVETETDVVINATPDQYYNVSKVTINGEEDTSFTSKNDAAYEKTLKADKNYTIEIIFAPNVYNITVNDTTNGAAKAESNSVEYNGSTKVYVTTNDGYTIDTITVNDTPVTSITKDADSIYFEIDNIADDQEVTVSFMKTATADAADLEIDADADLRPDADNLFVLKDGTSVVFATEKAGIRVYSSDGLVGGGETTQSVSIDSTMNVTKVELYYLADGEYYADWHVVDMDELSIVVDKGENVNASLTANPAANGNGYHNSNVTFEVSAEDTGDYSGLKLVEYWITYNGVVGSKVTLYEYKNGEEIKNIFTDSDKLVVDASLYNSDDVKVTLHVVDRAGNETNVEKALKINSTKPTVSLDITGTQFDNAQDGYYNDKRELTITIVDRKDTFSAINVAAGLDIKKNGEVVTVAPSDISWTDTDSLHIGKYAFETDGHYEWSITYTNLADLSNDGVTAPSDKNIYDFYIDKVAPHDLKVTYEPKFVDVLLETITFGFYKAPVSVTIEAVDDTAEIAQFEYSYTGTEGILVSGTDVKRDGTRAYATFTISPEFRGNVSFSATDKAGRSSEYEDGRVVVIDTIAPGVKVEWESNDAAASNEKYFNSIRTATIRIEEANFFADDVKDGLLLITQTKVLNDGTRSEDILTPEFEKQGNVYVATVTFNEDADYTFDITYTDRSGNVYDEYPIDEFTIDTIRPVIKVSYDNNTAINGNQFEKARTATITVTEHNFDENGIEALVNDASYSLKWTPVKDVADTYEATVPFPGDANYTFSVEGVDLANNGNDGVDSGDSVAPWEFTVDGSGPSDLKISYESTFVGTLLEGLTFGFYNPSVKVTIEATDEISGVDYFTYSYTVQDKASAINVGAKDVKVDVDGTTASATFEIPAQFRGFVSFIATNNAGVSSSYADPNVVVVDTIAPGITVEYTNNNALNSSYFKADRTATIKIEEANYFDADIEDGLLVITRKTVLNDGTMTEETLSPEFSKEGDVYTATIDFNQDADYTFEIAYTDRAGNENDGVDYGSSVATTAFTIDKIKPIISIEKANGAYFNNDRTAKITVLEHNFRASDFIFTVKAYNVLGKSDANKIDLSSKAYQTYLQNQANWSEVAADTWEAEITFDIEGNYTIGATYTDLAGNEQVAPISDTFCIDKSDPKDLKISYNPSFIGTLLETITFGFYQAPVEVTIEATDEFAGVDHFVYSYIVEAGASETNTGKSNVTVAATPESGTSRSYATFEIPAQFRGNVSFTAYDKATNSSFFADENVVIVDNVAPGVNVEYNNHNDFYDNYFMADRIATITITEANFFSTKEWGYADIEDDLLVITVGKTLNDGTYTSTKMKPEFTKDGNVYTATILFDENADYTFDIKYTDRSGNVYDSYETDKFTVDKIKPVIDVSYNDNEAKYENGDQFRTDRTATIKITEHNFNAANVVAKVTACGTEVTSYAEYLKNAANWKHYTSAGVEVQNAADGDVHIAEIKYTEEAHYTFEIGYTDMAGNSNNGVNYGTSVAPTAFTVDKSAPTNMDIQIDNVSVAGSMDTLAFNKFYDAAVSVKLSANCDISGLQSLKYQKVANASEYSVNGTWIDYNSQTGIVVSPSEKFIIYFRAEDRAGNVNIIRSTGIVVDNQKPVGETNAPEIDILPAAPNANGIHKGNVNVDLKVVDPKYTGAEATADGHYSGLNKITYKIYTTDTTAVEEGILFDLAGSTTGAVFDADKLASSWNGRITIDSSKFNSNNVIVEVTATDNAGNTRTTTTETGDIKIDITAPAIDVSYDNNDADSGSYFKANRTATIVVTERNFNPDDVKVTITNTDGVIPALSGWTKTNGTGNEDDTRWTATIYYSADGDYTFDITYTDLAENVCSGAQYGNSVVPTAFTIDKTLPTISVVYDNNSAENTNYYKAERTATITITEHNFNAGRVVTTITAKDDGAPTTVPTVSGWTTNGNVHTATIRYAGDALYSFDIAFTDMAGNVAADFTQQTFYVDKTNPTLEITGVENNFANSGDVIPVVSYSDTNYDSSKVTITLTGANRGPVELEGSYADIHNGRTFTFKNFVKEQAVDDIYTLTATLTDKAGNTTEQTITFSVNRFGSNYTVSDSTKALNGTYVKEPQDVVITETNANALKDITITLFKNNETITLVEGEDYRIDVVGGNGQWYQYTYTIFAKNFADDGVYRISIHSKDAAGNVAENTLDTKGTEIGFGVDKTNPTLVVTNLESGKTYALENLTVIMSANDNLLLNSVVVYLDNDTTPYKTWNAEEIAEILAGNGEFTFDVSGDSTSAHYVRVVCTDAAGNETSEEFTDFFVTTNLWVRYYNNKPLFFGSIGGVILLAGLVVFLVVWKRRKKEEQ